MFKRMFHTEGKFTGSMSTVADLIILSALWTVCCIPVITIPTASGALYYAIVKAVRKGHGDASHFYFTLICENGNNF